MRLLIILTLTLLFTVGSHAQSKRDRIKALKVSFLTERLNLTEGEAQKFWPVYNAYDENTVKLKYHTLRKIRHEIKDSLETLTDAKAQELLDRLDDAENKLHREQIQLNNKLKNIISPKKILLLKVAEEDFTRKLFEEFKNRRHNPSKK
ncbi:hypothetical protein [Snuella lapsa]|uniref:Sensor of ECF-type sigma factor n=1 Tax=Snuella lapsa TaxID=870481 RepID=A0ABP6Y9I8_9FLAO